MHEIAILADPLNKWALIQALARHPEAQEALYDTILLDPGNGWGWYNLAMVMKVIGNYNGYALNLKQAGKIDPDLLKKVGLSS